MVTSGLVPELVAAYYGIDNALRRPLFNLAQALAFLIHAKPPGIPRRIASREPPGMNDRPILPRAS
jgi:hypothetical protein